MRLIALLCWYDESPSWLAATTASVAQCCDHIVALDGRYLLFPGDFAASGQEQSEIILETAAGAGIGCTIHRPVEPYPNNEVEKRSLLFAMGSLLAEQYRDWFLVVDADDIVTKTPMDLRQRLADTDLHVAGVKLWHRNDPHISPAASRMNQHTDIPRIYDTHFHAAWFRALPNLRVEGAHMVNVADHEGRTVYLRGIYNEHDCEPILDLNDMHIEHRTLLRDRHRARQAQQYYARREREGAENLHAMLTR